METSSSATSSLKKFKLLHGLVVGVTVVAIGVYFMELSTATSATSAKVDAQGETKDKHKPREVDFGLAELDPGLPIPIPSYKNGGMMVLYAGEEFRFEVLGDGPKPALELRVAEAVQELPGAVGSVKISGLSNQPLPAVLVAKGSRLSLPGSAPPRISVKVQVLGAARPPK